MPGGNGTGPMGYGSITGRGMGNCAGKGGRFVRGCGMGFGGRGNRHRFFRNSTLPQTSNVSTQQELSGLKQQAELLHSSLENINRRIEQIEKTSAE